MIQQQLYLISSLLTQEYWEQKEGVNIFNCINKGQVIRSNKLKKARQYNGKKKEDITKDKQLPTQKTKDLTTQTALKTGCELVWENY